VVGKEEVFVFAVSVLNAHMPLTEDIISNRVPASQRGHVLGMIDELLYSKTDVCLPFAKLVSLMSGGQVGPMPASIACPVVEAPEPPPLRYFGKIRKPSWFRRIWGLRLPVSRACRWCLTVVLSPARKVASDIRDGNKEYESAGYDFPMGEGL
jgi:hypothetical protein